MTRTRQLGQSLAFLVAVMLVAGCASTKVSKRQIIYIGALPKPAHIWVYNFIASSADMPTDSSMFGSSDVDDTPPTPDQLAQGRELGAAIATQLAAEIRKMNMPGIQAGPGSVPQVNDLVIRGYLLSIKDGSAAKRVIIGFGAGGSSLRTLVEGFQVTPQGMRKLGSGDVDSGGNKTPGAALGVATFLATANPAGLIVSTGMKVYGEASGKSTIKGRAQATAKEIGTVLKKRFQDQGWIK